MMKRRTWLGAAALAGATGAAALLAGRPAHDGPGLRVLALGGTKFVGRAIVAEALARGHTVTLFNRGRTNPGLFPEAERIVGDRNGDHSELRGRTWDVVVDTSGTEPEHVQRACAALAGSTGRYVYTSSIAAYQAAPAPWTEDVPLKKIPAEGPRNYGEKKSRCEQIVAAAFATPVILRPAVLIGPHDARHRFVRWPLRAREGGELLVPGSADAATPFADVRDLAGWLVPALERGITGAFNIGGPPDTMGALIDAALAYGPAAPVWIDRAWLRDQAVDYDSLPSLGTSGYHTMSSARAIAEGLQFRGVAESMVDTLGWWDAQTDRPTKLQGPTRAREQELIAAWRARGGSPPAPTPG